MSDPKPLPYAPDALNGISDKTLTVHHDKLYAGYVAKKDEIEKNLTDMVEKGGEYTGNATYAELRGLHEGKTFATNGVYLHEWYFDLMGGDGQPTGALADALKEDYGSIENFVAYFSACGMSARGWTVLCWDTHDKKLHVFNCDAHNHGGIWGCFPVIVLDVYEHAYFMDYGSDRKAYIADFWKNFNWKKANELFEAAKK